jgi:hypothetical protein
MLKGAIAAAAVAPAESGWGFHFPERHTTPGTRHNNTNRSGTTLFQVRLAGSGETDAGQAKYAALLHHRLHFI